MDTRLLLITTGYIISFLITFGLGIFVLMKKTKTGLGITFFLLSGAVAIFELMFLLGINIVDLVTAYHVWLFNTVDIFIVIFYAHFIFLFLGKAKEKKKVLLAIYLIGIVLFIAILMFPRQFFPQVVPKMYLKSYPEIGPLFILMLVFFFTVSGYTLYQVIKTHQKADFVNRNRLKYTILGSLIGYSTGVSSFALYFNLKIDPVLSMFTGFYTVPFAYGILRYQSMDIRIVIKKTIFYSVIIGFIAWAMIMVSFVNNWFIEKFSGFHPWLIPLVAGVISFIIGKIFWGKLRETEKLKNEFIAVVAHKFRTPLTHIKWATKDLLKKGVEKNLISKVDDANNRLVELVDILLGTFKEEEIPYIYKSETVPLEDIARGVVNQYSQRIKEKKIKFVFSSEKNVPQVHADKDKISTVIRILLENALEYTLPEGKIEILIKPRGKGKVIFLIKDSGIGISKDELFYIFEMFYRTTKAKRLNTEGTGMGLFIAKNIIKRHHGKIKAESKGENRGSIFWFTLPVA